MSKIVELIMPIYENKLTTLDLDMSVGELIRCGDCVYYNGEGCIIHECKCEDDEFCSWAVRKKDD